MQFHDKPFRSCDCPLVARLEEAPLLKWELASLQMKTILFCFMPHEAALYKKAPNIL